MLECVVNVSEGLRVDVVAAIAATARDSLLDVHSDADHNRSVLAGGRERRDGRPAGGPPRSSGSTCGPIGGRTPFGVVDVVPFVPLAGSAMGDAEAARDRFLVWIAGELGVPAFAYGRYRTLPELRRRAFVDLAPDAGPPARIPPPAPWRWGPRPTRGLEPVAGRARPRAGPAGGPGGAGAPPAGWAWRSATGSRCR